MILTSENINRQLQIMNCCAAKKGAEYITKFENKIPCDNLFEDAELMIGLIDGIIGFVPEGEVISGTQASFLCSNVIQLSPATINITIGTYIYPTLVTASSATVLTNYINSFYPASFPYTASASGNDMTIYGTDYDLSNGITVNISIVKGLSSQSFIGDLAGGTPAVYQGKNCITNEEVQTILNKLQQLCSTPCEDIVNFE